MLSCKSPLLTLAVLGAGALLEAQAPAPRIAELQATVSRNGMDAAALKGLGEHYFGLAVKGDKSAVEPALDIYISLMQLEPAQALHVCRFGSLSTMKGRDASLPLARMWYVQKGLESMGKAVALAPDDLGIRLTRANTCNALPAQLKQAETAVQDCEHVGRLMVQAPGRFPQELVFQTRLLLASSLKKAGREVEARNTLEKLISEAQGTPFAAQAKELLK
jgi:hypothetical protein